MKKLFLSVFLWFFFLQAAAAEITRRVVDVPSRPGVTQRFLLLTPANPRAVAILFAGGHGGLTINDNGGFGWGEGNFLVRTREVFAKHGFVVAVIDKASDQENLNNRRQTQAHVEDVKAVMGWLRAQSKLPIWLVGTSRGTQSVAYVATHLPESDAPAGIVLTSTILSEKKGRPVPDMALEQLKIPVLVVHHERDGCSKCLYSDMPLLMDKLAAVPRKELITFTDGQNRGDPCEAMAYHGFNGIEKDVVDKIAAWVLAQ